MGTRDIRSRLLRRAAKADIFIPDALAKDLTTFLNLLIRWNRKINLTALKEGDEDAAIDRLLLEPLAAVRHLHHESGRLIDIGSGGGSPAIPMALARPEFRVTMVEAKARKAAFLGEAIRVLGLRGASVENTRFEDLVDKPSHHQAFTVLTIRAVRVDESKLTELAGFLAPAGEALLFRGPSGAERLPDARPLFWAGTHPLVRSLDSRLTVFRREAVTDNVPRGTLPV